MPYRPRDPFFQKAKEEGYLARSVYKLEEIAKKYRLLDWQKKLSVLELGAAPGSWSQWIVKNFQNPESRLFAVDKAPIKFQHPQLEFFQASVFDWYEDPKFDSLRSKKYHVILSDMAPRTTGIKSVDQARSEELCRMVLQIAQALLQPQGHLCFKLFHSEAFDSVRSNIENLFHSFKAIKPQGTRKESKEIFCLGLWFQPNRNSKPYPKENPSSNQRNRPTSHKNLNNDE